MRETLLKYIKENEVIQYGTFKLASGKESPFYLDGKRLTLNTKTLYPASLLLGQELNKIAKFVAVGGPTSGADPLVAGILMLSNLKGFMVRKEPKGHGTNKLIDGPVEPGMDVVIVEDTVTTGGSAIKAIQAARDFGLKVNAVGSIFFRGEKSPFDVPFVYLFKVDDKGGIQYAF